MVEDDSACFRHRAEVETQRAERATAPAAVRAHYLLAEAYSSNLAAIQPAQAEAS